MDFNNLKFFNEIDCAITICDENFIIMYMNDKAKKTFEKYGNCIGKSLLNCHNENSVNLIKKMITNGEKNIYTISKDGIKKLIYQTPWYNNGKIAGLIEFSFEIPDNIQHFNRN